jgi:hypothetical protein
MMGTMPFRIFALLGVCLHLSCTAETVDLAGRWEGTASLVVDGEKKESPLALELSPSGAGIEGTVIWGEHLRNITSSRANGPEIELECVTPNDRIRLQALFRNDALEGRFWIQYPSDPEPFPGRFAVARKQ